MDDVWKDLSSLPSEPPTAAATAAAVSAAGPPLSWLANQEFLVVAKPQSDDDQRISISDPAFEDATESPFSFAAALKSGARPSRKRSSANDENAVDRKRKRVMKNRESAVRSRARRQAYTYHLEAKVLHLKEENAELRKQQEKLLMAAFQGNQPKEEHKLHRTSTAPF